MENINKISGRCFNVSINPLSLHVNLFRYFLGWTRMKIRQLPTKKASKIDRHFQYGDSLANFRTSRKEEEMCKNSRKKGAKHQQNKW